MSDALIKYYSVSQTRWWYVKLDIVVVNSVIILKEMALAKQEKPLIPFMELLCLRAGSQWAATSICRV